MLFKTKYIIQRSIKEEIKQHSYHHHCYDVNVTLVEIRCAEANTYTDYLHPTDSKHQVDPLHRTTTTWSQLVTTHVLFVLDFI